MNDGVEIVHAYPTGVLYALHVKGRLAKLILQPFMDVSRDSLDLRTGIPLADDEKISGGIVQFSKVELYDVFPFDVLNAVNNHIVQRINRGEFRF